ncbi:MAG: amino acid ABC transporter substrate-binding protein [Pseudodesulfovibrio sp.]|nr:amino acid ABC transporter substrate-binding protein [Pseudodesulfovibrio sp.]
MKFISLVVAIVLISFVGSVEARQNLLFVADVDFAPYSMITEGKPAGIDVEVLSEAARRAGLTVDIEFKSWDELVEMIRKGDCDGAVGLFKNPEREKYAMFMDATPIHFSDYVLFTKVGSNFSFRTYADLQGKTIGRVSGITLGSEFENALAKGTMQVREYADLASAIKGLLVNEIDAYAGNIDVTYYRLKSMGMTSSIIYLPKKIVTDLPAYLVMSRASKTEDRDRVMQGLERALDQMRKDGTYNKIARRYLFRF